MGRISSAGLIALLGASACYSYVNEPPAAPQPQWEPVFVSGPPGGALDPGTGYQPPAEPAGAEAAAAAPGGAPLGGGGATAAGGAEAAADLGGAAHAYDGGEAVAAGEATEAGEAGEAGEAAEGGAVVVGVAPGAPGIVGAPGAPAPGGVAAPAAEIGAVTDPEIDATLSPYGQWIETEDYGRVWRPDPMVVGVDFTPYESCGSWVYTDYGWTFRCDWDWGWLPFHYGQWAWLDDGWCWVRDYTWSPAWVEWRSGGGYVGWRPRAPLARDHRVVAGGGGPIVRDHRAGARAGGGGPIVRDHRAPRDSDWRFASARDFGRTRIRGNLYRNVSEGLRVTAAVPRPAPGGVRVGTAEVMRSRFGRYEAGRIGPTPRGGGAIVRDHRAGSVDSPARGSYQPAPYYGRPVRGGYQPAPYYERPARGGGSSDPPAVVRDHRASGGYTTPWGGGGSGAVVRDHRAGGGYTTPWGGGGSGGGSGAVVRDHRAGGGGSPYTPPARPVYTPPARSGSDGGGWHSRGSSGGGGGGGGGGGVHVSGGGSRSSSSSSHSSSSGGGSRSHSSHSSSSSSSSSHSSSSGGSHSHSGGGGRHR